MHVYERIWQHGSCRSEPDDVKNSPEQKQRHEGDRYLRWNTHAHNIVNFNTAGRSLAISRFSRQPTTLDQTTSILQVLLVSNSLIATVTAVCKMKGARNRLATLHKIIT